MASIETNSEGYGTDPEEATTNTIFKYNEEITEPPEEGLVTPGAALLSSQMEQLEENISPGQPKTGDGHFQMVDIHRTNSLEAMKALRLSYVLHLGC